MAWLLLLPTVGTGKLLGVVTVRLMEGVLDPDGESNDDLTVVALSVGFSGTDVTPGLTVTVDEGKMLITGIVAVSTKPGLLLLSSNVDDRELSCELPGADVTPSPIVTVEDGKMLIIGIVAVLTGSALLLSLNVNVLETNEDEVDTPVESKFELESTASREVVSAVEGTIVDVMGKVDGVETGVDVEEMTEDSVERIGIDESPNVTGVDDCAGDETVVVELVNLLSTHGCLCRPSRRILYHVSHQ
ncbi:hypothetical protein RRF57_000834 [Xylaria bambusicola]|uniref:Uncharacterized protein n=1 Tax=Xylaria bambusicola TaxID=326684 RepID=A0AAN7Z2X3_9PEZI